MSRKHSSIFIKGFVKFEIIYSQFCAETGKRVQKILDIIAFFVKFTNFFNIFFKKDFKKFVKYVSISEYVDLGKRVLSLFDIANWNRGKALSLK